jgi:hypothetical protein
MSDRYEKTPAADETAEVLQIGSARLLDQCADHDLSDLTSIEYRV